MTFFPPPQLGSLLYQALDANASNWGALQMAGIYWRALGDAPNVSAVSAASAGLRAGGVILPFVSHQVRDNPASPQAVACYRRAFVHAPMKYKDMALVGLANTMQMADKAVDAITLAQMAIQVSPRNPTNHVTMGNLLVAVDEQTDEVGRRGFWHLV